jgi:hypothetical protein
MKYEPISTERFRSTRLTGKTLGAKPSILGSNPRWIFLQIRRRVVF